MPEDSENILDPEIVKLLQKYRDSRGKLEGYTAKVEALLATVDGLFPQTLDWKNKFIIEEKLKSTSSFFNTLLSLRQEINRSLTQEIEIRRKISTGDDGQGEANIRAIAEAVEEQMHQRELESKNTETEQIDNTEE